MSKWSQKLEEFDRLSEERYREAIWKILIAKGGALQAPDPKDAWGHFFNTYTGLKVDHPLTLIALNHLKESGIDLEKCRPVTHRTGSQFQDTFSPDKDVPYLVGKLVTIDGFQVYWGIEIADGDIGPVIRAVVREDLTLADAIEELEARLNRYPEYFKYACHL